MSFPKPLPTAIPPELDAEMTPAVRAFVQALLARIAELEARLGMNPRNSSLPPSSQHPHAKPERKKPKSKKRRGGQPGHPKHERPLIPTEQCNNVEPLKPSEWPPGLRGRAIGIRLRRPITCRTPPPGTLVFPGVAGTSQPLPELKPL